MRTALDINNNLVPDISAQWRIQGGAGGAWPPVGGLKKFFCQYINIITKPTAYDGPWDTKVAVCRRFLLFNRLVFAAFCCLCAVHCMQAAAASFVSPKAAFLPCKVGS